MKPLGFGFALPAVLLAQVEAAVARDARSIELRHALRLVLPAAEVDAIPDDKLEARWQAENARINRWEAEAAERVEKAIREIAANTPALPNRKARRAEKARRGR